MFNNCLIFKQVATVKSMFFKLRVANQSCLFAIDKTTRILASVFKFKFFNTDKNSFVFVIVVSLNNVSSTNKNSFFLRYKAERIANLRSFLLIFLKTKRGFGPNVTPPPTHSGDLLEPARAFPVPFCFQGFLPPPRTSDFVFVEAVYLRPFFNFIFLSFV